MDKSGGNPSKSTKKDNTHGQDYTKNFFIWTMVFTNKSESFWRKRENIEIRSLYKKINDGIIPKITIFAQLHKIESLHALTDCLFDEQLQKGVDLDSISISQLSRRLNGMNPDIFQRLFLDLVTQIQAKTHDTKVVMPLKIIDSSTLPLNLTNHRWAEFRKTKAGVKLHLRLVFMEKGTSYPEKAVLTTAKEHDRG